MHMALSFSGLEYVFEPQGKFESAENVLLMKRDQNQPIQSGIWELKATHMSYVFMESVTIWGMLC